MHRICVRNALARNLSVMLGLLARLENRCSLRDIKDIETVCTCCCHLCDLCCDACVYLPNSAFPAQRGGDTIKLIVMRKVQLCRAAAA